MDHLSIAKIGHDDFLDLIGIFDSTEPFSVRKYERPDVDSFTPNLHILLDTKKIRKHAVLGVDIYRYSSQFDSYQQAIIPFLFNSIYDLTVQSCLKLESFFFQHYTEAADFRNYFISTGDGGFQIFETPIHAIIFAVHFECNLRLYNAFNYFPSIRESIGRIDLRYAQTFDELFQYENNFYGPAIINCARILSKDRLNRFLIDESTYDWFLHRLNGIEHLKNTSIDGMYESMREYFESYNFETHNISVVIKPCHTTSDTQGIQTIDVMKIDEIKQKETQLSVYNVHLQNRILYGNERDTSKPNDHIDYTITLGNLNTQGLGG